MSTGKRGLGFIDYTKDKSKGHKVITKVHRNMLDDYVPQVRLRRKKIKK